MGPLFVIIFWIVFVIPILLLIGRFLYWLVTKWDQKRSDRYHPIARRVAALPPLLAVLSLANCVRMGNGSDFWQADLGNSYALEFIDTFDNPVIRHNGNGEGLIGSIDKIGRVKNTVYVQSGDFWATLDTDTGKIEWFPPEVSTKLELPQVLKLYSPSFFYKMRSYGVSSELELRLVYLLMAGLVGFWLRPRKRT